MIAAVDIGGTKIAVGMVNECGRVLAKEELPTDPEGGYAQALDRIAAMLRAVSARATNKSPESELARLDRCIRSPENSGR